MSAARVWITIVAVGVAVAAASCSRGAPVLFVLATAIAAWVAGGDRVASLGAASVLAALWLTAIGPWSGGARLVAAVLAWLVVVPLCTIARRWNTRAPAAAVVLIAGASLLAVRSVPVAGPPVPDDYRSVDRYLRAQVDSAQIPGLGVAVVRGDHVAFSRGYGRANSRRAMTADTPVVIGSTTKSITAAAVLELVERGLVELDAPITRYLDWYTPTDARARRITVRNLLVDTSGIPTWAGWSALGGSGRADTAAVRRIANGARLTSEPGRKFQYSNANYIILGQVIESVTGRRYADVVGNSIFRPLRMANTHASKPDRRAANRYWLGTPLPSRLPYLAVGLPAGAVNSSANDLARYLIAELGAEPSTDHGFLSPAVLALSHESAAKAEGFGVASGRHYAMGWYTGSVAGEPAVFHSGDVFDSSSSLVMLPGRNLGVVVVASTSSALVPTAKTLAEGVTSILVHRPPANFARSLKIATVAVVALGAAILAFAVVRARRLLQVARQVSVRLVFVDVVLPLVVLGGLPILFSRLLDRAETVDAVTFWRLLMRGFPDLVLIVLAALLIRVGAAAPVVTRQRFGSDRSTSKVLVNECGGGATLVG